jgi:hypothetical protein
MSYYCLYSKTLNTWWGAHSGFTQDLDRAKKYIAAKDAAKDLIGIVDRYDMHFEIWQGEDIEIHLGKDCELPSSYQ